MTIRKYARIWRQYLHNSFLSIMQTRMNAAGWFLGKLARVVLMLFMISTLFRNARDFAGYSHDHVFLIFATYLLIDYVTQIIFRGIYYFKHDIRKGYFDASLTKPIQPLFAILGRMVDMIDIAFFPIVIAIAGFAFSRVPEYWSFAAFTSYGFFFALALFVGLAIHIFAAAVMIIAVEADIVIWLYRYTILLGSFPSSAFPDIVRVVFTVFFPIFIMTNVPPSAFFGTLTFSWAIGSFAIACAFFVLALGFWNMTLRRYTSISY